MQCQVLQGDLKELLSGDADNCADEDGPVIVSP